MSQVSRLLNTTISPRPGGTFRLPIGTFPDDQVILEGCMPGGLIDFRQRFGEGGFPDLVIIPSFGFRLYYNLCRGEQADQKSKGRVTDQLR